MKRLPAALSISALALVGCEQGGSESGIAACDVVADVDVDDVSGAGFRAYWSGSDRTFVSLFVLAGDQYAEVRFEGIAAPDRQRFGAHAIDRLTGRGSPS